VPPTFREDHVNVRSTRISAAGVALAAVVAWPGSSAPLRGQAAATGVVAIRNATLLTVTRGTIGAGTIVLQNGKIAAIGANVNAPAGAEVIDGTGRFVSPGLIDAHSHIANDDINEGGTSVSSMVGMGDVLDPTDINIYRDLAGGTTTANILHGSANAIGGKTLVIKLRYGLKRPEDVVFEGAPPGIKFALGENVTRKRGQAATPPERFPTTRQGVDYVMRDAFTRAKAYKKAWDDYGAAKGKGQDLLPPKKDLQLDALVEVLEGKRLVHCHSYRADEILMMIRVADEMGFKVATFQHVLEGYKVAKEIAAHGAGASTFSDWWGYKIEAEDAIPYNAAIMTRKGVVVSINSDDAEQARRLNNEAAKTVRYGGLSDDEALATVTINPAKQLRIDSRVGSLEVGKDADVVIWNHHPLSTAAIVDRAYIDGKLYYDRVQDLDRIAAIEKEKGSTRATPTGTDGTAAPAPPQAGPVERLDVRYNASGPTWAITNARIVTVSGAVIPRGTVVIKGNRIDAVGESVTPPAGAKVVDAAGANIYPGFVDAATDIGLNEPGPRNYDDVSEIGDWNQALRTERAFQMDSDAVPVDRVEGVTTIAAVPGGGVISGSVPVMDLDGWTWEEGRLRQSAGLVMTYPGGGGGGRGGRGGAPTGGPTPAEQIGRLNALFERAAAYAKAPAGHPIDLSLEPFLPILNRSQAFIVNAGTEQSIRDAVAWAERQHVRVVIRGGADVQRVASFLKEHDVPVILTSVLTLPPREDEFHAYPYQTAGVLAKAGVRFAFSSGGYQFSRNVPFQAGRSVAWGLDHDAAIRAITLDAARILGVDSQIGSIEAGKLANLVVMKGDALEIRSQIQHVVIAGRDVPLESKHTELYKRFMARE
jgi:imidazolonepropionase-like amidohydrolase